MDKLPEGWRNYKLGEIALKLVDGSHNPPPKENSGFPMYSGRNLINGKIDFSNPSRFVNRNGYKKELRRTDITSGDIFLSIVGTIGNCAVVPDKFPEFCIQRSIALIRTEQNPFFIKYFFESPKFKLFLKSEAKGSAQKGVYLNSLQNANIQLPPLPEQKRIVSKLDGLFERIDQSIGLLEENIKHTEALMASALDEVFGEGSIPIKDVCEINPKKSEVRNLVDASIEVSFLPMAELNEFRSDFNASQTKEISEVYKGYTYFKESDVLLAKVTPCFENGKAGISRNLKNGIGFGSSEFHVIRPNEKILPDWIYYSVLTQKFRDAGVLAFTGSSGLKRVPAKFVQNWKISLPPIDEQRQIISRINEAISKLTKVKSTYMGTLDFYKSLKESILDKAFKGEL